MDYYLVKIYPDNVFNISGDESLTIYRVNETPTIYFSIIKYAYDDEDENITIVYKTEYNCFEFANLRVEADEILDYAVENSNLHMINYLIKSGDVKLKAEHLIKSIKDDDEKLYKYLLENNVPVINDVLKYMIKENKFYWFDIKPLIESGCDINWKDENNTTILIHASKCDRKGIHYLVKYLVDKGADINWKDNNNDTAISCAKNNKHLSKSFNFNKPSY